MPLKPIGKFWKRRSTKGATYYAFTTLQPIPAGAKVMLFRRESSDDESAGNVCIAVDDEQPNQSKPQYSESNPFRDRHRNRGGYHTSPATDGEPLAMQAPLNATSEELTGSPGDAPF